MEHYVNVGQQILSTVKIYLRQNHSSTEQNIVLNEIHKILEPLHPDVDLSEDESITYEQIQHRLAVINEKTDSRKAKGIYYTPADVVNFILTNSVRLSRGELHADDMGVKRNDAQKLFEGDKTIFDPTCGTGEFLLLYLEKKFDWMEKKNKSVSADDIKKTVASVFGNDIDKNSTDAVKVRFLLAVLHRFGARFTKGLAAVMNRCFYNEDYVAKTVTKKKFDLIVGNPPYVEDNKCDSPHQIKYGNIYANVLHNAACSVRSGGVLGFVIPLSYVATPRMKKIRRIIAEILPCQYILSYSDRPDCLFSSVHQKLCILFAKNVSNNKIFYTGHYTYWYKKEREQLFKTVKVAENSWVTDDFIPKLGAKTDLDIYAKVKSGKISLNEWIKEGEHKIYLGMRVSFWIKAFSTPRKSAEYKTFGCKTENKKNIALCLLNSSLFWWYWVVVSDCWHITGKELKGFFLPPEESLVKEACSAAAVLSISLEKKLEATKVFVGTKQTVYEYKHRQATDEIRAIDDFTAKLYNLTDKERHYVENFARRYRLSEGAKHEGD